MSEKSLLLANSSAPTPSSITYTTVQVDTYVQPSAREKLGLVLYEWFLLLLGTLGALGMGATPLLFYYFFGNLIGEASTVGGVDTNQQLKKLIQTTSYQFFFVAGVAGICSFFQTSMFLFVGEHLAERIRRAAFRSITRQEIAYFDQTETGVLVARLSEDAQLVRDAFSEKAGQACVSIAQFCGGIGYAFYLSWPLTLAMLATAPVMGVAIGIQGYLTVKFTKGASDASAQAISIAEEVISSIRTVRAFSQEDKEVDRFAGGVSEIVAISNQRSVMQGISLGLVQAFIWGSCGIAFLVGSFLVGNGKLQIGELFTVFGMMLFAVIGISVGLSTIPQFAKAWTAYTRVLEIVHRQPRINFDGGNTLQNYNGEVTFQNVSFKYDTRERPALSNVSFHVPRGKTVAFVGESGSGKSTIFSLLERFYDVTEGSIMLDTHDIRSLDIAWMHHQVAMVSQEPVLFGTTIAENISYANDNATREQIEEAARTANAHEFIVKLPLGYDTQVGERGVQLSGGQKQRIAIARAVLCNPKVLLLDEATSALDTQSEKLVQDALDRIMVGKTCLVIAHRLATVKHADCIIVMRDGEIAEQGTHEQLLEADGVYRTLAQRQLIGSDLSTEDHTTEQ